MSADPFAGTPSAICENGAAGDFFSSAFVVAPADFARIDGATLTATGLDCSEMYLPVSGSK